MQEIWLRSNPRAALPLLWLPALLCAGGWAGVVWGTVASKTPLLAGIGALVGLWGLAALSVLIRWSRRPRLAYGEGQLSVLLDASQPVSVPIDIVECFFRGTGETLLPGAQRDTVKTSTIIVRLAEAATDWHARPSRPAMGTWADGYITLRGTWCEPITPELLRRLNARLVAVHRELGAVQACDGSSPCSASTPCSTAPTNGESETSPECALMSPCQSPVECTGRLVGTPSPDCSAASGNAASPECASPRQTREEPS